MRREVFSEMAPGRLVKTIADQPAFVPANLPPVIDFNAIGLSLAEAMQAVGELRGACRRLRNPAILIAPLQRREALTSSAMEGTFTTEDELVLAQRDDERAQDNSTREVSNYIRALNTSLEMLKTLPISHRIIKEAHRILLSGLSAARGAQKRPGEYKQDQNWIGGRTIDVARYVPPPRDETQHCMDALETYINREDRRSPPPLIDLAFVHYQFEAIHPFADGNGRVGRMLISLMAVESGLLEIPALYISPALEHDKDRYIDLMFAISTQNRWHDWLNFFFERTVESCRGTIATIDRLISLEDEYRSQAHKAMRTGKAGTLVEHLFERPAITVGDAEKLLGVTYAAARNVIERLVAIGILEEYAGTYPKIFIARGILRAATPA